MKNWLGQELNIGSVVVKIDDRYYSRLGVITAARVHEDYNGYKTDQVQCDWKFEGNEHISARKPIVFTDKPGKPGWCVAGRLIVVDKSVLDNLDAI